MKIMTAMTMIMTTSFTVMEILKVFIISFVKEIAFKILVRTTLLVKGWKKRVRVIGFCDLLHLKIHIVKQVDKASVFS